MLEFKFSGKLFKFIAYITLKQQYETKYFTPHCENTTVFLSVPKQWTEYSVAFKLKA
jgi:hypothetical protein